MLAAPRSALCVVDDELRYLGLPTPLLKLQYPLPLSAKDESLLAACCESWECQAQSLGPTSWCNCSRMVQRLDHFENYHLCYMSMSILYCGTFNETPETVHDLMIISESSINLDRLLMADY